MCHLFPVKLPAFLLALTVLLSGCIYDSPPVRTPSEKVDPSFVGNWRQVGEPTNKLLIRAYDRREYSIITDDDKTISNYRAYTCEVAGLQLACVQELDPKSNGRWAVFEYSLSPGGQLSARMLNEKVVTQANKTPRALRRAIRQNIKNPELFLKPAMYEKAPAS